MKNLVFSIENPIVCAKCESEFRVDKRNHLSLQDYVKIDVGFTKIGIQIWCQRHDINICHVDFDNNKLMADFRCIENKKVN